MTKYFLAAAALVAALLGGWGVYGHYRVKQLKADVVNQQITIQNQNTAILAHQAKAKRDTAVLRDVAARAAALASKQKEDSNDLSKALQESPDWASTPVPPAILEWLRDSPTTNSTGEGFTSSAPAP
jgi:uncharacterized protein HemX